MQTDKQQEEKELRDRTVKQDSRSLRVVRNTVRSGFEKIGKTIL